MARCSSLKCQMALNPAFNCFVAFFLSFPYANQMLLCFVQAMQTHCILHLSAEGWVDLRLFYLEGLIAFHGFIETSKMGAFQLIRRFEHFQLWTACRFGHMFSLETGPVLQVEMACCSSEYSLKLQWWNDVLIYLISSVPIGWVPWKQIAWHDHARTTLPNPSTIAKRDESHLIGTSAAPKPAWCNSKLNLFHVWGEREREREKKTDRTLKTTARFVQDDCICFHLSQEKILSTKARPAPVRAQWFVVAHGWWPEASQEPREEDKAPPGHLPKWNRWNRPRQPGKGWGLAGFPEKVTETL